MFCGSREIPFDCNKLTNAILKAFGLRGSPEWNPISEIIDMMVAAACGDFEAQENWEQHCIKRDEKLSREQELRSITYLLTSVLGRRNDKDHISDKVRNVARKLRRNQLRKRQSECDGKATELAAMMPVPPLTFVWKGGPNVCATGV